MKNIEKRLGITKAQKETVDRMMKKTLSSYKSAIEKLQHA